MKVRNGFVSNSSSSSFCLYGVHVPEKQACALIDESLAFIDELENKLNVLTRAYPDLTYALDYECGDFYIGFGFDSLKDNETGAEFRARAQAAVDCALSDLGVDLTGVVNNYYYSATNKCAIQCGEVSH